MSIRFFLIYHTTQRKAQRYTMSWAVDPEALILEVECRPLLYSKCLPDYSNKVLKNNVWMDLSKKLSVDWENLTNEEKTNRCK